jgi:hypothetical protein
VASAATVVALEATAVAAASAETSAVAAASVAGTATEITAASAAAASATGEGARGLLLRPLGEELIDEVRATVGPELPRPSLELQGVELCLRVHGACDTKHV